MPTPCRFLISGYYGFGNAGDEAVLAAILEGVEQRFPGCEARVLSGDPVATRALHGVEAVQRWSLREVWRALGEADVLIQGGGGLLQDATSKVSSLYYLGILRLARLRRVPAMVFVQGIGPLKCGVLRWMVGREFPRLAAITVRDEGSLRELAEMGVRRPEVVLVADPAVLLDGGNDPQAEACGYNGYSNGGQTGLSAPREAVLTLRAWPGVAGAVAACRELVAHLSAGHDLDVIVTPFQEPDDIPVCQAVAEGSERCRLVTGLKHPREFVGMVAGASLVVSMRLHGLIFAAAQGVPAVGISYDPKLDAFAARAGQKVVALEECSAEALIAAAEEALSGGEGAAQRRGAVAAELQAAAERSFEVLAGVAGQE